MSHLQKLFEHLKIQLEAIKSATNNFDDDNCIGRGGFGKVYKGELVHSKGQTIVALKRLDQKFGQGIPEFWKEITMLSLYKHENIVSLLGFCDESDESILVYEYAPRRSLDSFLDSDDLSWVRRLEICIGAARGLAYLHNPGQTQQRVLHRDIKSPNILLDEDWNAKISDLGLSKFGPANQQHTFLVSRAVGTIGYCDPIYVETGLLTKESDVYSFGVVLFEVLCGRLCISTKNGIHRPLIGLVREYYAQNKIKELVYDNIKDQIDPKSLETFTKIAYQCLNEELKARPLMADVVATLESALKYQRESEERPSIPEPVATLGKELDNLYLKRESEEPPLMPDPMATLPSIPDPVTTLPTMSDTIATLPSSMPNPVRTSMPDPVRTLGTSPNNQSSLSEWRRRKQNESIVRQWPRRMRAKSGYGYLNKRSRK